MKCVKNDVFFSLSHGAATAVLRTLKQILPPFFLAIPVNAKLFSFPYPVYATPFFLVPTPPFFSFLVP